MLHGCTQPPDGGVSGTSVQYALPAPGRCGVGPPAAARTAPALAFSGLLNTSNACRGAISCREHQKAASQLRVRSSAHHGSAAPGGCCGPSPTSPTFMCSTPHQRAPSLPLRRYRDMFLGREFEEMCAQVGGSLALCCAVLRSRPGTAPESERAGPAGMGGAVVGVVGQGRWCRRGCTHPLDWPGCPKHPRSHLLTSLSSVPWLCVQMYYRGRIFWRALSSVWSRILHARTARARCPATRPSAPAWPGVPAAARALPPAAAAAEHAPHFVAAGKMFGLCVQAMFFLRFLRLTEIARWLCLHAPPHACSSRGCAAGPCACTA